MGDLLRFNREEDDPWAREKAERRRAQAQKRKFKNSVSSGAEGGSRTRTSLRTMDFKSTASAIPPPRHVVRKPKSTKSLLFSLSHQNREVHTCQLGLVFWLLESP